MLNNYGQLGTNNSQDLLSPVEIDFFKDKEVIQATTLSWANIVLTKDGKLYSAGYSLTSGQNTSSVFAELEFFSDKKVIKISSGYHFTVVLCENGDIYSFGEFTMGEINNRIAKVPINITEIPTFFKCGYSFGCFLGYFRDLENDFLNFFKAEEFTDLEIQGVKVHRQLVELRIGKTIDEKMIDHLTRYYETEIRAFMLWVYTGQYDKVKKDVVIEIIKELDIVERSKMSLSKFLSELLEDEDSSDFTILIPDPEDEEEEPIDIPVHKIVLMARSGLYREMFKKVKDKSTEVTDQSGMSPESVELLVKFLYTAKVSITADDDPETVVNELQDAKEYYQLNTNTSINVELQKIRREFKLI
ncbi:btk-binding protein-related [Anaeramoeba flamelloides]|uniref:Btk-binding protein-related n=1 Tax=Anaeramoeba flamelloides TaxID=1746091 RepID=A0ABQ8YX23_9EUKA|nr:btk-binding protein-related [Anaeramoeba flamelloides]